MPAKTAMTEETMDCAISLLSAGFSYGAMSRALGVPVPTLHRVCHKLPRSLETPARLLALLKAHKTRKEMVPSA
jgi:hypothetical protein